jgi:molybdopterin converting factor small subunit
MRVYVEFLAVLSELVGIKSEWKEIAEGTTVEQLWRAYVAAHPRAARVRAVYAVNRKRVDANYVLRAEDRVSFLPPISGGMAESPTVSLTLRRG